MIWKPIIYPAALTLVLLTLAGMHPFMLGVAIAQDDEDYPDYILHELEVDRLKREAEMRVLRQELDALSESEVSIQIAKFNEVISLLKTDKELRDMLKSSPELYPLYKSTLGENATITLEQIQESSPSVIYDASPEHCACLSRVRVRWLGHGNQAGEAVVALGSRYYDIQVGDTLGTTSCVLNEASIQKGVTLVCDDPSSGEKMSRTIALQNLPDTQALRVIYNEHD